MPFENEHAARISEADRFDDVRRKNNDLGDGIHAIYGITDSGDTDGEATAQIISIRFDKSKFSAAEARKWLADKGHDVKLFEPAKAQKAGLVQIDLVITKANIGADGNPRCLITASDTGPDRTGERTSLSLFGDWIERIEKGQRVPFLPAPREPFLGISHYPDLEGFGEAGTTEKMYIDGQQFKAVCAFYTDDTHPLGPLLFQAVRNEWDVVKRGGEIEQPIRISAAWWDLQHSHGDFVFTRRSLTDRCPMCVEGAGDKMYLKGQLDHWAATRVPINPRTSMTLEEKAMTITRKDDAETIIGEDLAEELDKRAKLVGKSEADDEADGLVIKADEEDQESTQPADEAPAEPETKGKTAKGKNPFAKMKDKADDKMADGEDDESDEDDEEMADKKKKMKADVEKMDDEYHEAPRPLGGAVSLADAEAVIEASQKMAAVRDNWGLFMTVFNNIQTMGPGDEEDESELVQRKLDLMEQAVTDLGGRISALKANLADAYLVQTIDEPAELAYEPVIIGRSETMTQEQKPQTGDVYQALKAQVEDAITNGELSREQKAEAIQKGLNDFAGHLRGQLNSTNPPDVESLVNDAVQKSMAPITEQLALLNARLTGAPAEAQAQPQQKSLTFKGTAITGPTPDQVNKPTSIREIARRSVGLPA